jgi:iron complex outermembrane receptor protein
LYGPNAVLGVINIITSRGSDKEILARGYLQAGTVGNISAQTYLNYNLSEKIAVRGSYNYFASNRNQVDFYYNGSDQFVNSPSDIQSGLTTESMQEVFYNPEMALRKSSGNFNLDYEVNEKVNFTVGTGINHSEALYPIVTMSAATPMINDSYFAFVNANIHGFSFLGSLLSGHQGLHGKYDLYSYDYNNLDLYIDYNWTISKNFSIRPAVNYQRAMVNDLPYTEGSTKPGLFNNKASNYNAAASIKADYKTKKLRLIAAIRTDKFQYPTELYPAYQFAFNYYLDENNMIRLNWSRSNGGAFMAETFTDYVIFQIPSFGGNPGLTATLEGNRERKLLTNELQEIGYRTSIGSNLQFDLSLFRQTGSNFTASVNQDPEFAPMSNTVTIRSLYQNLSLNAEQLGATFSANIIGFNDLIHFKPFITFQKTNLKNYSPYYQTAGNNTDDNIDNTEDVEGTTTPSTYGGFYLNVLPSDKFSLNLNGYSFGSFESLTISSVDQMTGVVSDKPESHIESKFILNAVFNVKLSKGFQVFLNGRNIFNTNNREMFGTSMVGSCYLAGINVTL